MQIKFAVFAIFLGGISALGQTASAAGSADAGKQAPATADKQVVESTAKMFQSEFNFSYGYPADWTAMDTGPITPAARLRAEENAKSDMEKKGSDCTQINLMITHGDPKSLIMILVLPYACVGDALKQTDLTAAAQGMAEGLKSSWDIRNPKYGAYKLGSHEFWIERATGSPKAHPEVSSTVEVSCGMLTNAMVCWMGFLHGEDALKVMESGLTTLEGESAGPLVPAGTFKDEK